MLNKGKFAYLHSLLLHRMRTPFRINIDFRIISKYTKFCAVIILLMYNVKFILRQPSSVHFNFQKYFTYHAQPNARQDIDINLNYKTLYYCN